MTQIKLALIESTLYTLAFVIAVAIPAYAIAPSRVQLLFNTGNGVTDGLFIIITIVWLMMLSTSLKGLGGK